MRKLVASVNITLDGFYAGPNGEMDWHFPYWDNEMAEFAYVQLKNADCILLGRKTYEMMSSYWPSLKTRKHITLMDQQYAAMMNSYPKLVFSKTLLYTDQWLNTSLINNSDSTAIISLKEKEGHDILLLGSGSVVAWLCNAGLIDEYVFFVHPVTIGNGRHLFKKVANNQLLELRFTKKFENGVVLICYKVSERGEGLSKKV